MAQEVSRSDGARPHWRAKLTRELVDRMRAERAAGVLEDGRPATVRALWEKYGEPHGVSFEGIRAVLRFRCWK